jgi:hypothetical protein
MDRWYDHFKSDEAVNPQDKPAGHYSRIQRRRWRLWINWTEGTFWYRSSNQDNTWTKFIPEIPCPAPMLRAQLIALRNSGGLNKDCDYVITDFNSGQLGAGTEIHLQAVSPNELGEAVLVNTTYDNEAWRGRYDIDTNTMLELTDNRNNTVRDTAGTAVVNFDWGNATYTRCYVDNSTLTLTIGLAGSVTNLALTGGSTLNISTFTGTLSNFEVHAGSNVNLSGANGTWSSGYIHGGTINATGYTGGGVQTGLRVQHGGTLTMNGILTQLAITNLTIQNSASLVNTATGGNMTIARTLIDSAAVFSRTGAAGTCSVLNSTFQANASINHTLGQLTFNQVTYEYSSLLTQTNNAAAVTSLSFTTVTNSSSVINASSGTLSISLSNISGSIINRVAAGTGTITLTRCQVLTNSTISSGGSSTGTTTFTSCGWSEGSTFTANSTAVGNTLTNCSFSSNSTFSHSSAKPIVFARVRMDSQAGVTVNSTGVGGTYTVSECKLSMRGTLALSDTHNQSLTISQIHVTGLGGSFQCLGTATAALTGITRLSLDHGTFTVQNTTASPGTCGNLRVESAGSILLNATTVAVSLQSSSVRTAGSITLNGVTSTSTKSGIDVSTGASYNANGAAAVATNITLSLGGIYTHNGGNSLRVNKSLASILTSGAFNHNDIYHHTTVANVLTVANAGRGRDFFNNNLI